MLNKDIENYKRQEKKFKDKEKEWNQKVARSRNISLAKCKSIQIGKSIISWQILLVQFLLYRIYSIYTYYRI